MINAEQQEKIAEIFQDTEVPEKVSIELDPVSRTLKVTYEDLDYEWFKELKLIHEKKDGS